MMIPPPPKPRSLPKGNCDRHSAAILSSYPYLRKSVNIGLECRKLSGFLFRTTESLSDCDARTEAVVVPVPRGEKTPGASFDDSPD